MISRLALRQGPNAALALRCGTVPMLSNSFHTNTSDIEETKRLIERWDACNKKYFGPSRDLKNFPHPTIPETHEAVRLGFIPRSWMDALYSKTGVSGPYFALFGLGTFVMSKEILVVDHGFFEMLGFWAALMFITKNWGSSISKYIGQGAQKLNEKNWAAPMEKTRSAFSNAVSEIDTKIAQEARHKYIFDIQRENLDLQLEARYRERVAQVYDAVKRRLDYQLELVNAKKRFEQQHMVDWIVDNVVKGITPKQEKEAITSCIANLQALAKAQPAV